MVVTAVRIQEEQDARDVHQALEDAATAVSGGPESTGWLTNECFLVAKDSADTFLDAVEEVRRSHPHLEVRVDGPLPPYSFVDPGPSDPVVPEPPD
jgi:hypothetical protein